MGTFYGTLPKLKRLSLCDRITLIRLTQNLQAASIRIERERKSLNGTLLATSRLLCCDCTNISDKL